MVQSDRDSSNQGSVEASTSGKYVVVISYDLLSPSSAFAPHFPKVIITALASDKLLPPPRLTICKPDRLTVQITCDREVSLKGNRHFHHRLNRILNLSRPIDQSQSNPFWQLV
jgi:hypothetical protein